MFCKSKLWICLVALAMAISCGSIASADEIAADSFLIGSDPSGGEYSTGDLVPQNPTLSTFNSAWVDGLTTTTTGTFDALSTGLFWPDLPNLGGGSVQFENAASIATTQSVVRGFDNPVGYSNGDYYIAGLMSFDENFSTAATSVALTGLLNAEEGDASVPWVIGAQWGFQGNGAGGVDAVFRGRRIVDAPNNIHEAATDVVASNLSPGTHLFVIKVNSDYIPTGSTDKVYVWIDPDVANSEQSNTDPDLIGSYTNWLDPTAPERTVKTMVLNATDVGDEAVVGYDEVRIGETWDGVIADPANYPDAILREGTAEYEHLGAEVRSLLDSGNRKLGEDYPEIIVGNESPGSGNFRGLLAFGTEGIPAGSTVTDVELTMTVKRTSYITGVDGVELRLTDPSEAMVESEVTWNDINILTQWTEGGGDPTETVLSSIPAIAEGYDGRPVTFSATPEFLAAAQAAVDGDDLLEMVMLSPAAELIMGGERNFVGFWSDDATVPNYRPLLRIVYTEGEKLPGDANLDGVVDDLDAAALADNWQTASGATWAMGDFNDDGAVDDIDATILATNWQTSGGGASVPEPSTFALLGLLSMATVLLRRRAR